MGHRTTSTVGSLHIWIIFFFLVEKLKFCRSILKGLCFKLMALALPESSVTGCNFTQWL